MNFLTKLWNDWIESIKESDNSLYKTQIKTLLKEMNYLKDTLICRDNEIAELNYKIETLEENLEDIRLSNIILENYKKPKEVQQPKWLKGTCVYNPQRRFVSKTKDIHKYFGDCRDVFDKSVLVGRMMKQSKLIGLEKNYTTAKKVMKFVTSRIKYENDLKDNWRPLTDIFMFGFGDCDDSGGIAITSCMGIAGWNDDETFTHFGNYYPRTTKYPNEKFYHAWNETLINGEWWVLEGTDPNATPQRKSKVKDKYVSDGAFNWKFKGGIDANLYLA